jgi:hypothetical protein
MPARYQPSSTILPAAGWSRCVQGENVPLTLLCPGRRQLSPLVRLLHQFLAEQCAAFGN